MEEITEGKTRQKVTSAMINAWKLNIIFELKAKYDIRKGTIAKVTRPVQGRTRIEKEPIPDTKESTQTSYQDFLPQTNCMFLGTSYDHWTGRMYLEFICDDRVLYYDWWQHGAGDTSFGEIFVKVADPTSTSHGLV